MYSTRCYIYPFHTVDMMCASVSSSVTLNMFIFTSSNQSLRMLLLWLWFSHYFSFRVSAESSVVSWAGELLSSASLHVDCGKRALVGVDMHYLTDASAMRGLYGLAIDDILQTVNSALQSIEWTGELTVHTYVCFHAVDESRPLILDTKSQTVLQNRNISLIFLSEEEEFCGERYFRNHVVDKSSLAVARDVTNSVLRQHPHWSPSSGQPGVIKEVNICVVDRSDADDETDLFNWHFFPSPGANTVNRSSGSHGTAECAFHYPMDGVTLYPATWNHTAERSEPVPQSFLEAVDGPLPYATHIFLFMQLDPDFLAAQDSNDMALTVTLRSVTMGLEYDLPLSRVSSYFGNIVMFNAEKMSTEEAYLTADLRVSLKRMTSSGVSPEGELCSQEISFFLAQKPYGHDSATEQEASSEKQRPSPPSPQVPPHYLHHYISAKHVR